MNAEQVRADAEAERAAAEAARQAAFETNEANRQAAFDAAEAARASAETARAEAENARMTAETERVEAENARAQTFSGYQGEIDGLKDDLADKLPKSPVNWEPWSNEEQAAAREMMGIPGDFELIEEIVLEEDASIVERAQEPDGAPYNFVKVVVILTSAKTEYGGRTIYARIHCGSVSISVYSVFSENLKYYKRSVWRGQIENSELRLSVVDNAFVYGDQGSISGDASAYKESANCAIVGDNITKLETYCPNGESIPKGFLMQIYGVRAV